MDRSPKVLLGHRHISCEYELLEGIAIVFDDLENHVNLMPLGVLLAMEFNEGGFVARSSIHVLNGVDVHLDQLIAEQSAVKEGGGMNANALLDFVCCESGVAAELHGLDAVPLSFFNEKTDAVWAVWRGWNDLRTTDCRIEVTFLLEILDNTITPFTDQIGNESAFFKDRHELSNFLV